MAKKGERATHCKNGHAFTPGNVYMIDRKNRPYQRCKTCSDERNRAARESGYTQRYRDANRYGLTPQRRSSILVSQDGLCAICYDAPAVDVDHDHETGQVRGMLCRKCNVGLGLLGDSLEGLNLAVEYLTRPWLTEVV